MTFAAIPWLSISINLLLVVFVIVCLLMTLLILMQRPKQEGLGAAFGGGVTDQVFGARTTNVLQKGTVYCGTLFFVLALLLAILIGHRNKQSDLLNGKEPVPAEAGAQGEGEGEGETPAPEGGTKPADDDLPSSLLDELPGDDKPAEGNDKPVEGNDKPAEGDDKPVEAGSDKPAEGDDKPVEGDDKPSNP